MLRAITTTTTTTTCPPFRWCQFNRQEQRRRCTQRSARSVADEMGSKALNQPAQWRPSGHRAAPRGGKCARSQGQMRSCTAMRSLRSFALPTGQRATRLARWHSPHCPLVGGSGARIYCDDWKIRLDSAAALIFVELALARPAPFGRAHPIGRTRPRNPSLGARIGDRAAAPIAPGAGSDTRGSQRASRVSV